MFLHYNKPPIVLIAKVTPAHFATISFPIASWLELGTCLWSNAIFSNNDQDSASERPFNSCTKVERVVLATFLERVVIIILLSFAPPANTPLNRNHFFYILIPHIIQYNYISFPINLFMKIVFRCIHSKVITSPTSHGF